MYLYVDACLTRRFRFVDTEDNWKKQVVFFFFATFNALSSNLTKTLTKLKHISEFYFEVVETQIFSSVFIFHLAYLIDYVYWSLKQGSYLVCKRMQSAPKKPLKTATIIRKSWKQLTWTIHCLTYNVCDIKDYVHIESLWLRFWSLALTFGFDLWLWPLAFTFSLWHLALTFGFWPKQQCRSSHLAQVQQFCHAK